MQLKRVFMVTSFAPPPTKELQAYAHQLFERRNTAAVIKPADVSIGNWRPRPNHCHENARTWADNHTGVAAVQGWLVMNLGRMGNKHCTRFIAHSVIRDETGEMWDITPNAGTFQQYAFLPSEIDEETYFRFESDLHSMTGQGNLHHYS